MSPKHYPHVAYGAGGGEDPSPALCPAAQILISVRKVCWTCSVCLAGCRRARMVSVPSSPREEDTDVGSTSSGSWHLWVKVFMTVPSPASCEGRRGGWRLRAGPGTLCPLPLGEACGHALCAVLIFISPQVWWRGVSHPEGQWCLFWSCWVLLGGGEIRGVGRNHLEKVRSWGWAAASLSGLMHRHLVGVMRGDK